MRRVVVRPHVDGPVRDELGRIDEDPGAEPVRQAGGILDRVEMRPQ
jgi:hypothetical protein